MDGLKAGITMTIWLSDLGDDLYNKGDSFVGRPIFYGSSIVLYDVV